MTNNEKKKWLQRYRECWAEVEITQQEIEELNSRAQKITASLSPTPGGGQRADFTLTVDRIIELKEKLDQQVRLALLQRAEIETAIEQVRSPLHRRVLRRRYLNGDTFEKIAVDEDITYNHLVSRIHPQSLDMLECEK